MNELHPRRRILQSFASVLAGFLTTAILSVATDAALYAAGLFPGSGQPMADSLFVLATAYRTSYTVAGSYITARLAPHRPMRHAMVLGVIGVIAAAAGAIATWDRGPDFGPHWYPIAIVAVAFPSVWAGAKLREWQEQTARVATGT